MNHAIHDLCPHCSATDQYESVSSPFVGVCAGCGRLVDTPLANEKNRKQTKSSLYVLFTACILLLLASSAPIMTRWIRLDRGRMEFLLSSLPMLFVSFLLASIAWISTAMTTPNVGRLRTWAISATAFGSVTPGMFVVVFSGRLEAELGSSRIWEPLAILWMLAAYGCFSMFLISLARRHLDVAGLVVATLQLFLGAGLILGWVWKASFDPGFSLLRSLIQGRSGWDVRAVEALFLIWQVMLDAAIFMAAHAIPCAEKKDSGSGEYSVSFRSKRI